jgi:hypothetical protein
MFSCMRTSNLQNEPPTRFNVGEMSKKIEIEVPDDFYEMLQEQAAAEKIPFIDLVRRELGVREGLVSFEELSAQKKAPDPADGKPIDWVQAIREGRGE